MNHACSAYCRDGLHADVLYTPPLAVAAAEAAIARALVGHGWEVETIEPAREARPADQANELVWGNPLTMDQATAPWLVWMRRRRRPAQGA